jgi:hypothetical protein
MLLESSKWHSTKCFLTWRPLATPQGRLLFQLAPSMPNTNETEYGLWRTPAAQEPGINPQRLESKNLGGAARHYHKKTGRLAQISLSQQVKLRTKLWPTPAASNGKGCAKNRFWGSKTYSGNLDEAVRTIPTDGQLNPTFVEWLMGYPIGHTELKD